MINAPVLLLNSTYEPLNVINVKRALRLLLTDKADSLEQDGDIIRAAHWEIKIPTVVRLSYFVKRPIQRVKFTKGSVLMRDDFRCQYCGERERDLTLDHIIPKTNGGQTIWTNVVACCKKCNSDKGGQSLKESGMKLLKQPKEPRFLPYLRMVKQTRYESWDKYLFTNTDSPFLLRGPLPGMGRA